MPFEWKIQVDFKIPHQKFDLLQTLKSAFLL